jgi:hypothetical protein
MFRLEKLAPLTGILGIAGVLAGLATDTQPDSSASSADLARYLASQGHVHWFAEAMAVALGGTVLLVFASVLGARVEAAGAGPVTQRLVQTAASAWGLLTMLGGALFGVVPLKLMFYGPTAPSAAAYHLVEATGYAVLVTVCAFAASLLAVALSVASWQTGLLPRWLTLAGFPAALLMLANMLFPMSVITLYFVAVAIALVRRTPAVGEARTATAGVPVPAV